MRDFIQWIERARRPARTGLRSGSGATLAMLVTLGLVGMAAPSCSDDDDNGTQPMIEYASLRALHLSPDAPAVDIFLDQGSAPAVNALGFEQGTGYLQVPEGSHDIDISADGDSAEEAVLSVENLQLDGGKFYTAVAYGTLDSIAALALVDDYRNLALGKLRVRAIHAAAGVGRVDIWNVTDPQNPAPLYVDFDFGEVGAYLDLPAGSYSLGFDVNDDGAPDLTFVLPALPAGTVANVFAVAEAGGAVFLLAQFDDGTTARVDAD